MLLPPLCFMAALNDHFADVFTSACAVTKCQLTPWSLWWFTRSVTSTVTTTVRVICGIHDNTTDAWANTLATVTTSRTDLNVLVLDVTNNTECSCCFQSETTNFT
jgi:hypothetical protein